MDAFVTTHGQVIFGFSLLGVGFGFLPESALASGSASELAKRWPWGGNYMTVSYGVGSNRSLVSQPLTTIDSSEAYSNTCRRLVARGEKKACSADIIH